MNASVETRYPFLDEEVFDFLADGTNDPKFSPRVQEIRKTTDGPIGVGTVFESSVKDAGLKSSRKFELTEFERPTKIRWAERSKNSITVPTGGVGHHYQFSRDFTARTLDVPDHAITSQFAT